MTLAKQSLGETLYKHGLNGSFDIGNLSVERVVTWTEEDENTDIVLGYEINLDTHLCDYVDKDIVKDMNELRILANQWIARGNALLALVDEHCHETLFVQTRRDGEEKD